MALLSLFAMEYRMAEERRGPAGNPMTPPAGAPIPTDLTGVSTVYTNFCRVSVTPDELVLDFGLQTQVVPNPTESIKLSHRVVMNFYTAKRLLGALMNVVQQHENAYGSLELDFQKRMRSSRPAATLPPLTRE
jgi:hypothetical protein